MPANYPANVGVEYRSKVPGRSRLSVRLDLINAVDQSYALNDGAGIGAPRFGARRGWFGGISCAF